MLPVVSTPTYSTSAGTFSLTVTGYYEYWTTEVAKITQDSAEVLLESTFIGKPLTVFVATTAQVPVIAIPAARNSITTHWRLYRSVVKETEIEQKFPVGYQIAEGPKSVSAQADTRVGTTTNFAYPTLFNTGASFQWRDAVSATAVFADDGNAATLHTWANGPPQGQTYYGFNFGGFAGSITEIEVQVQAWVSSGTPPAALTVQIGVREPTLGAIGTGDPSDPYSVHYKTGSQNYNFTGTSHASSETVSFQGLWIAQDQVRLNSSDFGADFAVSLQLWQGKDVTLSIDFLKVRVTYEGSADPTHAFDTVVYTFGDEVSQVGKNGVPPSSSTGDIFQDSLVVNDLNDKSLIRYSYPGEPESFPESYYLNFETRENDAVQMIRVVNNRLVIGLGSSLWRVNYLPSEKDATFDRGKATECISKSYGVINQMCCCTFTPDGPTEQLAFVSDQGVHYTDGYNFTTLTDGVDWRGQILSTSATSSAIALINDKENQILRFYFRNGEETAGEETYLCLPLCYGAGHWVNGQAKVGGLLHMRNYHAPTSGYASLKSVWNVPRDNGSVDFLFGYGGASASAGAGKVYRETGTTIPSYDGRMQFTTRRMYLAGLSKEWRLNEVYGYCGSYSGGPVVTYTAANSKTNDTGETTLGTKSITLTGQALHKVQFQQMCEGLRLLCIVTGTDYRQENLVLDGENFGLEDSGR
jgi:hypothetical protein